MLYLNVDKNIRKTVPSRLDGSHTTRDDLGIPSDDAISALLDPIVGTLMTLGIHMSETDGFSAGTGDREGSDGLATDMASDLFRCLRGRRCLTGSHDWHRILGWVGGRFHSDLVI
jgi:hypothetical protein